MRQLISQHLPAPPVRVQHSDIQYYFFVIIIMGMRDHDLVKGECLAHGPLIMRGWGCERTERNGGSSPSAIGQILQEHRATATGDIQWHIQWAWSAKATEIQEPKTYESTWVKKSQTFDSVLIFTAQIQNNQIKGITSLEFIYLE